MTEPSTRLVESPDRAVVVAEGADAATWLNGLVTCDVAKIGPGQAAYGLVVNTKGRILADVFVVAKAGGFSLVFPRSEVASLLTYLNHYLVMEDVVLEESDALVAFVLGGSDRALPKVPFLGEPAALFVGTATDLEPIRREATPMGAGEIEALRLRRGVPKYGIDFGGDTYPQEAGLEKIAVSFSKGCYLGQEVVCMLEMRGQVRRKLALLRIQGDAKLEKGAEVSKDGAKIGEITSAVTADADSLAFAMLKLAGTAPGTTLEVAGRRAEVVAAP